MSSQPVISHLQLFLGFAVSAISAWALTYASRWLAHRFGVLAKPSARRRHEKPTPLLGGFGIFVVVFSALGFLTYQAWTSYADVAEARYLSALMGSMFLLFGMGAIDDAIELPARPKFLVQLIASGMVIAFEPNLPAIFNQYGVPDGIGYLLTFVWVIGLTNAFNLIDGLDGLCSGVATVASLTVAVLMVPGGNGPMIGTVLAGAALGFLVHNFHPAKIFLGDSGSLLLGFTLSVLSLKIPLTGPLPMAASVMVFTFGVPIIDTTLAIIRRIKMSRPIFSGDRSHLHHRLQNLGFTVPKASLMLVIAQMYLGVAAMAILSGGWDAGWAALALSAPVIYFGLRALKLTELMISTQSARFSQLFLSEELRDLSDESRLRSFLMEQIEQYQETRTRFSVVVMDCSVYYEQILSQSPSRLVSFYVGLYETLKGRLRKTDMIVCPTELQLAVILPKAWEITGKDSPIFDFLKTELKRLQETYGVFQGDPRTPEGFRVLVYPEDRAKIFRALNVADDAAKSGEVRQPVPRRVA